MVKSAQRATGARPPSALLPVLPSGPPEFKASTNKNFAQRSGWSFFKSNGAIPWVLRKGPSQGRRGRALWGSEEGRQSQSPRQLLQHVPTTPAQPSPSTRLASLTGTAASWHVLEEPSLRGREKKKITTNVPPIMSHEAELLFLPCWILPFPWYFPSSGWEPR